MASRKEEKERLREAREQAEARDRRQQRKRLILGYAVAGVIALAVVAGIVVVATGGGDDGGGGGSADAGSNNRLNETFGTLPDGVTVDDRESSEAPSEGSPELEEAAAAARCELLLDQKDEGSTHIDPGSEEPAYESKPATSGDHSPEPLADGAFASSPSPLNYIHALEHGRIEIQYSTDLPEQDQLQLLGLYDEDSAGMIVFPNDEMPYLVAATAWRNVLGCDSYEGAATLDAIRAFRSQFRARGPEPIAMS